MTEKRPAEQRRKLILFDIDGTLLDPKTNMEVPKSAVAAIHKLRDAGHVAMINTGRCASFMEPGVMEVGFDGVIYGCGTNIVYHGEELFHQSVSGEMAQRLKNALRKHKIDGILEGREASYFDYGGTIRGEEFQMLSQKKSYKRGDYEDAGIKVDKLYIRKYEDSSFDAFYQEFERDFSFIDRGRGYYELVPNGVSKATGIERMMEYLQIPVEDTCSIGDSTNDLPMLTFTGMSIAMGNSMEEILPYVTHVTKNIEEDGIAYAVEHFIL